MSDLEVFGLVKPHEWCVSGFHPQASSHRAWTWWIMLILGYAAEFPCLVANVEDSTMGSIPPYRSLPQAGAGPGQTLKIGLSDVLSGGWTLILLVCFVQCWWGMVFDRVQAYLPASAPVLSPPPDWGPRHAWAFAPHSVALVAETLWKWLSFILMWPLMCNMWVF